MMTQWFGLLKWELQIYFTGCDCLNAELCGVEDVGSLVVESVGSVSSISSISVRRVGIRSGSISVVSSIVGIGISISISGPLANGVVGVGTIAVSSIGGRDGSSISVGSVSKSRVSVSSKSGVSVGSKTVVSTIVSISISIGISISG